MLICKCQDRSRKRNQVFHIGSCEVEHNTQRGYLSCGRSFTTLTRRGRYVGGTGNVNGKQIFPSATKEIPSQMSTLGKVGGQYWVQFGQRS